MYSAKNVKWVNYLIILALIAFVSLLILANVKSKSYYQNLKKENNNENSRSQSIVEVNEITTRAIGCTISNCVASCSGDMADLKKYLDSQKQCASIKLRITDFSFPNDRLESNWLDGSFNLSFIQIANGILYGIDSGAFNKITVAYVDELQLDVNKLQNLTEDTFVGLQSMETFTLFNKIEIFSADSFLKPMMKTLKKIVIKQVTSIATDPEPWLRGDDFRKLMVINFDYNNFGGYINAKTFQHLTELNILSIVSCKMDYLADGTFDFLMKHSIFYLSLENNRLNRIAGDYLTKAGVLKKVGIEGNPWDCTCELEGLIKEYTRDPGGFGENAKCSTPLEFSGKKLNEVKVEPCKYSSTALTTIPSTSPTTIITTLSISSSSSTDESTSTLITSTETTPSDDSTTLPSTLSSTSTSVALISPTSPKEPSTTLSTSTFSPPDLSSSTTSLSSTLSSTSVSAPAISTTTPKEPSTTLSTSTSSPPDLSSTTTAIKGPGDDQTASPPPNLPTPSSPQNRTTTMTANTIFIECQPYTVLPPAKVNTPEFFVELSPPDTQFDIFPLSQSSVALKMESPTGDLALIWFYDQPVTNGSGENIRIVGEFQVGCQSELVDSLTIEGLALERAYTFCLVKKGVQVISPFNCRSYYTSDGVFGNLDGSEVWLKCEDKALTIGLFILGIIIALCIGVVSMFIILRIHPSLLKGSKRVILVNRSTGDVLIMPRLKGKSSMTDSSYRNSSSFGANTNNHQRRYSDTSIQSGRSYMMANNYEDIEYRWKMNVANDLIYANRVPKSPPPPLPKLVSQNINSNYEIVDKMKTAVAMPIQNDYGYIP